MTNQFEAVEASAENLRKKMQWDLVGKTYGEKGSDNMKSWEDIYGEHFENILKSQPEILQEYGLNPEETVKKIYEMLLDETMEKAA